MYSCNRYVKISIIIANTGVWCELLSNAHPQRAEDRVYRQFHSTGFVSAVHGSAFLTVVRAPSRRNLRTHTDRSTDPSKDRRIFVPLTRYGVLRFRMWTPWSYRKIAVYVEDTGTKRARIYTHFSLCMLCSIQSSSCHL